MVSVSENGDSVQKQGIDAEVFCKLLPEVGTTQYLSLF